MKKKQKQSVWKSIPEYNIWSAMRQRCLNEKHPSYSRYGGRGITVCDQWADFNTFLADIGKRPTPLHTLDRIDNDGSYEPSNVRWATRKQQINNRSVTLMVNFQGRAMSLSEACDLAGNDYNRVHHRISAGWDISTAITTPALERHNTRRA